ncbi:MAG: hypothetical protein WD673_05820 [Alphaproteobacteria bacterium]
MRANTTAYYRDLDAHHHLHPFTDAKDFNARGVRVVAKVKGIWLETSEGERLIDDMAGLWCVNIGYGSAQPARSPVPTSTTFLGPQFLIGGADNGLE